MQIDIYFQTAQALKSSGILPVCLVIKLCTDDQSTVDFYNSIDSMVGIPVDVLDDYYSEALEIYLRNSWLNYAGYHSTGMSQGYHYYVLYMFLLSVFSRCLYPCCSCFCSRCKISFREIGIRVEVLDTLDERALTMAEIYELCSFCLVPMARRRKASQTHIGVDVVPTRGVGNGGA